MKIFRFILIILYRIWFYLLVAFSTLVLCPLLFISISKESWYPFFFKLARVWAKLILFGMGLIPVIKREVKFLRNESYMFVSNHASMTDIMLMFYVSKNPFVFVGKKELAKIPLFGFFYKRTCILVDRSSQKSKHAVFQMAQDKMDQGLSICIFPEGGVPDDPNIDLSVFKDGAFRLAIQYGIPIAPMTFHDNKRRLSFEFLSGSPGSLRVKVHHLIPTHSLNMEDKAVLKKKTREIILEELLNPTV
jgi:1-acyl-sn-glycerol-3-phosphate acyltransferase